MNYDHLVCLGAAYDTPGWSYMSRMQRLRIGGLSHGLHVSANRKWRGVTQDGLRVAVSTYPDIVTTETTFLETQSPHAPRPEILFAIIARRVFTWTDIRLSCWTYCNHSS